MNHDDRAHADLDGTLLVRRMGHDFNNLFSIVLGGLSLLREEVGEAGWNEESESVYNDVMSAAREATDVVARLTAWAGRQALDPEPVDLGQVLHAAAARIGDDAATVSVVLPPSPVIAWVDRRYLQESMHELLLNAVDAVHPGGAIRLTATADPGPALVVSDDGCGMTPEVLAACREPYFTMREDLGRRGLGLSVVDGFVHASGGTLHISSEPARGTQVTLKFPTQED